MTDNILPEHTKFLVVTYNLYTIYINNIYSYDTTLVSSTFIWQCLPCNNIPNKPNLFNISFWDAEKINILRCSYGLWKTSNLARGWMNITELGFGNLIKISKKFQNI